MKFTLSCKIACNIISSASDPLKFDSRIVSEITIYFTQQKGTYHDNTISDYDKCSFGFRQFHEWLVNKLSGLLKTKIPNQLMTEIK